MKILFVNRYFYPDHSATSQMLADLAFNLAHAGFVVGVVTSRQRYEDPAADLPAREEIRGVNVYRVSTPRFGRTSLFGRFADYLGFYVSASRQLWDLVRAGDVIVAMTDPPMMSVPAAGVARLRQARLVNWLQDLFPEVAAALGVRGLNGWAGRVLKRMRNWSLRQANMNVAIGELMGRRLSDEGIAHDRIVVIPNWADGAAITPVPHEENPLRRQWGLQDRFVVSYSGNLGRAHEFNTILDSAEKLLDDPRICVLLIGGGAQAESVRAVVKARRLGNVIFYAYQPRELLKFSLSAADLHLVVLRPELEGLIVPSKTYGCLAAGRPVIFLGDPAGEIGRMIANSGAGRSCQIGDAMELTRVIREMAAAPNSAAGASGRAVFESGHDLPIACARFSAVFAGLQA